MILRNAEYRITFRSDANRFYLYFAKDDSGWYQITSAGNRHKATAEQVLNHILPALAKVKPGVKVTVEYTSEGTPLET
ncbi:MAG: hypothetical protein HIU84_13090 [Acidobacteria bacterium]|nr:hypothetical protein [Acidobacteriota bacterium]